MDDKRYSHHAHVERQFAEPITIGMGTAVEGMPIDVLVRESADLLANCPNLYGPIVGSAGWAIVPIGAIASITIGEVIASDPDLGDVPATAGQVNSRCPMCNP